MLWTVQGDAFLESRIELIQLVFVEVGHGGDPRQVHALLELDLFEIGLVGDRVEAYAIGLWGHHHLRQGEQLGYVISRLGRQRQVPVVGGQAEFLVALDGAADPAFTGIVGSEGEQPVAVEHFMQPREVIHRRIGRGHDVAAAVVPTGLA
ncbi:hypothetical protein D9M68_735330 [compost metagenome]